MYSNVLYYVFIEEVFVIAFEKNKNDELYQIEDLAILNSSK